MIRKICNRCGKFYTDVCPCKKRTYAPTNEFYTTKSWRSLSKFVRQRDMNTDRLSLYLASLYKKFGRDGLEGITRSLADYLLTPSGLPKNCHDVLVVHHIVPRDEDEKLLLSADNLITLWHSTHEYVHQLYKGGNKSAVQKILWDALKD